MLSEIIFYLKSKDLYDEIDYNNYANYVIKNINFKPTYLNTPIDPVHSKPDLIICEDTYDTINKLVESIEKSEYIENVFIFDDIETFDMYFKANKANALAIPRLLTLDFMYNSIEKFVVDEIVKGTEKVYLKLKKTWEALPIIGITNFRGQRDQKQSIESLLKRFEEYKDPVYDKVDLYPVLHRILDNEINRQRGVELKTKSISRSKGVVVDELNSILLAEKIDYTHEAIYNRIVSYLNIQEKVLNFATSNNIRIKTESLAAAIIYYEQHPNSNLDGTMLKDLYNMNKETKENVCQKYGIPKQPLAAVKKYFVLKNVDQIFTKEARIIFTLLRGAEGTNWPVTISLAETRLLDDSKRVVTFLDDFVQYV